MTLQPGQSLAESGMQTLGTDDGAIGDGFSGRWNIFLV